MKSSALQVLQTLHINESKISLNEVKEIPLKITTSTSTTINRMKILCTPKEISKISKPSFFFLKKKGAMC